MAADDPEGTGLPQQRPATVDDFGMGDPLYHDAARLKILLERHKLHTVTLSAAAAAAAAAAASFCFLKPRERFVCR